MILRFTLIIIALLLVTCLHSQSLEFYKERIEIKINKTSCNVYGDYYFRNNENRELISTIFYPFIVNDTLPFPENIQISSEGVKFNYQTKKNGLLFCIKVPSKDSLKLEICYSQPAPIKVMEYILTSTKYWNKPFEEAEYIINIPAELKLDYTSLNFTRMNDINDRIEYYLKKVNYLPDKNFIIVWSSK